MPIAYKDFFPALLTSGFLSGDEHETFDAAVARTNAWIAESGIRVINVETVVLPNVKSADTSQGRIRTSGELGSFWFQVVRVWYEVEPPPAESEQS